MKRPSASDAGGFFVLEEISVEDFCCRTKFGSVTYIMCKRGEDNQGRAGTESFCRKYQKAASGNTTGLRADL